MIPSGQILINEISEYENIGISIDEIRVSQVFRMMLDTEALSDERQYRDTLGKNEWFGRKLIVDESLDDDQIICVSEDAEDMEVIDDTPIPGISKGYEYEMEQLFEGSDYWSPCAIGPDRYLWNTDIDKALVALNHFQAESGIKLRLVEKTVYYQE